MAMGKSGQSLTGRRVLSSILIVLLLAAGCATTGPAFADQPTQVSSSTEQLATPAGEKSCEELARAEAAEVKVRSLGEGFGDGAVVGASTLLGLAFYGAGFVVLGGIGALVQASKNAEIRQAAYDKALQTCLEASRPPRQPDQPASAPPPVPAALPIPQEKKWVEIVSAEAEIFETKPDRGVAPAVLELAKRGDILEYTGQREYRGGAFFRNGFYLEVKNRQGKLGWIHEADAVELRRDWNE